MEIKYTAYARTIDGVVFYFVKCYHVFPELYNVAPVLESYGMHPDFKKACRIAAVYEKEIQQALISSIHLNFTLIMLNAFLINWFTRIIFLFKLNLHFYFNSALSCAAIKL